MLLKGFSSPPMRESKGWNLNGKGLCMVPKFNPTLLYVLEFASRMTLLRYKISYNQVVPSHYGDLGTRPLRNLRHRGDIPHAMRVQ